MNLEFVKNMCYKVKNNTNVKWSHKSLGLYILTYDGYKSLYDGISSYACQ